MSKRETQALKHKVHQHLLTSFIKVPTDRPMPRGSGSLSERGPRISIANQLSSDPGVMVQDHLKYTRQKETW